MNGIQTAAHKSRECDDRADCTETFSHRKRSATNQMMCNNIKTEI